MTDNVSPLLTPTTTEALGPDASFQQVPWGKVTIDMFTVQNLSRLTVDHTMTKAAVCIAAHSPDVPYFVIFDQFAAKSSVLMSPYTKSRVAEVYGAAKCKLYVAVIVNHGFLDLDSRAFLAKQPSVQAGQIMTQFFTSLEDGFAWEKEMIEKENLSDDMK